MLLQRKERTQKTNRSKPKDLKERSLLRKMKLRWRLRKKPECWNLVSTNFDKIWYPKLRLLSGYTTSFASCMVSRWTFSGARSSCREFWSFPELCTNISVHRHTHSETARSWSNAKRSGNQLKIKFGNCTTDRFSPVLPIHISLYSRFEAGGLLIMNGEPLLWRMPLKRTLYPIHYNEPKIKWLVWSNHTAL